MDCVAREAALMMQKLIIYGCSLVFQVTVLSGICGSAGGGDSLCKRLPKNPLGKRPHS